METVMDKHEIQANIEETRKLLNQTVGPLSTGIALEYSLKLDELIINYYRVAEMTA